jgi:hypothetical protein
VSAADKPDARGPFDLNAILSGTGKDWDFAPVTGADREALDPVDMRRATNLAMGFMLASLQTYERALKDGKKGEEALPAPVALACGIHRTGALVPLQILNVDEAAGSVEVDTQKDTHAFIAAMERGDPAAVAYLADLLNQPEAVAVVCYIPTKTTTLAGTGDSEEAARADADRQIREERAANGTKAKKGATGKNTLTVTVYTPFHDLSALVDLADLKMPVPGKSPGMAALEIGPDPKIVPPYRPAIVQAAYWSIHDAAEEPGLPG